MWQTIDVDLYRSAVLEVAEAELRLAATQDIGDWFWFEIGARQALSGGAAGARLPVTASIGATQWCSFRVDLVGAEIRLTGQPERVPALALVAIPDVEQPGYVVYPLVVHVADKVAAILTDLRRRPRPIDSKDLVDLVAIVSEASVDAAQQDSALRSEADRRSIDLPTAFSVPDRGLWDMGYAAEAGRFLLVGAFILGASTVVKRFLDPS
ncbi:hypothetical protein BMS3Abin02_00358 [bacterium BMS3Abin02]|nr:hypothetical protein BMS3Abin02_00358 [bacterium BMS3Abin02]